VPSREGITTSTYLLTYLLNYTYLVHHSTDHSERAINRGRTDCVITRRSTSFISNDIGIRKNNYAVNTLADARSDRYHIDLISVGPGERYSVLCGRHEV